MPSARATVRGYANSNFSPLQAEIERLSALCDQHELKYRASKVCY